MEALLQSLTKGHKHFFGCQGSKRLSEDGLFIWKLFSWDELQLWTSFSEALGT